MKKLKTDVAVIDTVAVGMAGQFNAYYYELSQKIAEKKVESIEATGADVVVTAFPGCQFQLLDALTRQSKPRKVVSLVEILH